MEPRKQQKSTSPGVVIAICGASRSGKTTLAKALLNALQRDGVATAMVSQDSYRRSGLRKFCADGRVSWEGPEFTRWADLHDAVRRAQQLQRRPTRSTTRRRRRRPRSRPPWSRASPCAGCASAA